MTSIAPMVPMMSPDAVYEEGLIEALVNEGAHVKVSVESLCLVMTPFLRPFFPFLSMPSG
jgi:hypothetical protein